MSGWETVLSCSHTPTLTWPEVGRAAELTELTEEERRSQQRAASLLGMLGDRQFVSEPWPPVS